MIRRISDDTGPDETFCRTSYSNLAYTDRDIAYLQGRISVWEDTAHDPLSPRPRRDRTAALASRARTVIEQHNASRPAVEEDGAAA